MRRLVITFGLLVTFVVAALLLLPWWLGAALPTIGRTWGLGFNGYARDGYSRFRLESMEVRRGGVTVQAKDIQAETPVVWLWHRWTRNPSVIIAGDWSVDVRPQRGVARQTTARGWMPLKQTLGRVADRLDIWLPRAKTGSGAVRWPGHAITFGVATWEKRTLTVADVGYLRLHGTPTLTIGEDHEMRLALKIQGGAGIANVATQGANASGWIEWWGQRAEASARFAEQNWAPAEAMLRATKWEIAGERLALGANYTEVQGEGRIEWRDNKLTVDASATGVPREKKAAPPLTARIRGHLGAGEFVADAFTVDLPGVSARLSAPLAISFGGQLRSGDSRFVFDGDLAKLPWVAMRGAAHGEATISSAADRKVAASFSMVGENVGIGDFNTARVEVRGGLAWPKLMVERAEVALPDQRSLVASGSCDFRERSVKDVIVRGTLERSAVARWLPKNVKFDSAEIDARANGPWNAVVHEGSLSAKNFSVNGMKSFDANATWRGRGVTAERFEVNARAGGTKLAAAGSADREQVKIASLSLERGDGAKLVATQPAAIRWRGGFSLETLHLAGGEAALDASMRWAETGALDVTARRIGAAWLRDLFPMPKTVWTAESLAVKGQWAAGTATFSSESLFTVDLGSGRSAQISARAQGDGNGIKLASLRIAEGEGVIVNATGEFPVTLHPHAQPLVRISQTAPFSLNAATSPNPEFWKKITELTGFEAVNPEVTARLEGSLEKPRGEAQFRAERVTAAAGRFPWNWPKIEGLDVHLTGDERGVKLDRFTVAVEGQALHAEGSLPVAAGGWVELFRDPVAEARRADLRVEVPDADLAAVARYFPAYLAPKGRLQIDLSFKSNETINGFLRVKDATSRPLGPLGVLQEVNADVRFEGRAANLAAVTARMGGQLVTLKGRAELPPKGSPQLNLQLTGENLPFVRQAGLLVRGDLDLKMTTSEAGRTAIAGTVRLRDSLFLSDIRSLIPTGRKGTASRPPYFSIDTEPLSRWRIDVRVEGKRFMRLRTPVFNGTASTRVDIAGTLGEPRATGEATIEEGTIRLPFSSFEVQQGQVRLAGDQPEPQLFVTATTRRYGYDLRMEITGAATAPNLTFTSSPPLSSEQVLLMVMAGQAPRDEIVTTDRQRAARFGAFFGQSLLGALGGNEGADRLTISSGENISAQGRETYSIEYKLNNRWSLTGEYDEFDEYYGGVKWRFYQKGGKRGDAAE